MLKSNYDLLTDLLSLNKISATSLVGEGTAVILPLHMFSGPDRLHHNTQTQDQNALPLATIEPNVKLPEEDHKVGTRVTGLGSSS